MNTFPSVNQMAWDLVKQLIAKKQFYRVNVEQTHNGATVIDAGLTAVGGFEAGCIITEICMGGLGRATLSLKQYGDLHLPSITVYTDNPAVATLGAQFAGWRMKEGDSIAIGSGPGRAIALKPKEIYQEINYKDEADHAVLVLETNRPPSNELVNRIADACHVKPENLALILVPTACPAGLTQVTGRVVETGIHKLRTLGLNPNVIRNACGYAPIPPLTENFETAMARTNDAILYGGVVYCTVDLEDEETLRAIVEKATSKASRDYGKPFIQIFEEAGRDFYRVDHNLFAPAKLLVNSLRTGRLLTAGEVNAHVLKASIGLHA